MEEPPIRGKMASISKIPFTWGRGARPTLPGVPRSPRANSPTGVSSLISRYVSKKWLVKKGSRFTWPGNQRTRVSVKYPHGSFWKETQSGGCRGH